VFCAFSVTVGLLNDLGVAFRVNNSAISWRIGLVRALEELGRLQAERNTVKENDEGDEEGA
jgi:hypothetical protein